MDLLQGFSQCWPLGATCQVNWTAWATVASGLFGALTAVVGWLAWKTSQRAAAISASAVEIAAQQHRETVRLREDTSKILTRLLLEEVSSLPIRVAMVRRSWEHSIKWGGVDGAAPRISDGKRFEFALQEASRSFMPSAEQVQERIHNLPDHYGANLATLIGGSRTLNDMAHRIKGRLRPPTPIPGTRADIPAYASDPFDFLMVRNYLSWLFDFSKGYANEFRALAGIELIDFSGSDYMI
ncbi:MULTISPECIES: hypothetical protein [Xanthomonas]|uniref:hypothetical protein n=1 Tax=Xanthomonas TaxID=338 RepID=UPI001290230E|nr:MULTISPECIES: hypothetical protein [Xanthomonas]MEB2184378.1 hypothetical protein [Xanthomonas campestris pv. campestris]MEB2230307.1 hypothetical protein [Xanthomonas campestris pv. campestris]